MNPQDPLANLQPLRTPEAIGWWPLAPGWWLLLFICVACIGALTYWLYRRHQEKAYRRQALRQLQSLKQQHQAGMNTTAYLEALNALLKRVAIIAYPGQAVSALHSTQWVDFLNSSARGAERFCTEFATAAYDKNCTVPDTEQLHRAAQQWIKHHGAYQ